MSAAAQKVRPKAAPAEPEVRRRGHEPVRATAAGAPRYLKASLRVGGVNDPEEREAEHAASVVASGGRYQVRDPGGGTHLRASDKEKPAPVRALAAPPVVDPGAEGRVRRAPVANEVVDPGASGRVRRMATPEPVRRASGPPPVASDAAAARRIEAARAAVANPLPAPVKARLEHGFGHKLDAVRVHTGPTARAAAASIGARAYTEGNRITLGDKESEHDLHLMAHETTHVVQNRAAVARAPVAEAKDKAGEIRRAEAEPAPGATPIRRFGLDTIKNFFVDHANNIPGFRMFTIVIGVNPLTMQDVDASPANILRAVVELMPLGAQIVQALDKYAVFDKVGAWVSQQIKTLAITGSAIGQAVSKFLDSLHLTDIASPGDVWDRAKQIFTEPIARITSFVGGLVDGVIQFVKDAVIHPLADLASKTRAWDLLIALLGKNPITGDSVPQTAETLIGGFMKLAGQDEVWENIKKSNAIGRAFAWFKGAMAAVLAFAQQIPGLFLTALKSFKITDLLDLPGTIARVVGLFGDFAGRFISWALDAAWKLAEIVFDAVSPGAWGYVQRTGAALKSILKNPMPFVGNLVQAAKLGLQNFAGNIGTHLKTGLIDWLTGSLPGVYIPKAFSLVEVGKFALSVLGITWAQIRGKIVKALGPSGEKIMAGLETAFDVVVALVKGGPAAAWEVIKDKLGNLKDMVIEGITSFVVDTIVKKAIPKLVAMFIPGAGFISAIISIYGTIMAFMERLSKIVAAVTAFIDSIVAIAAGQIAGAAAKVESALAGVLSLAIGLLAGFLGLGGIAAKVMAVVEKVRGIVDKALDTAIAWIVGKAKALFGRLFGKGDPKDDRTDDQKKSDLAKGVAEGSALLQDKSLTSSDVTKKLPAIQKKYRMTALSLVVDTKAGAKETDHIHGAINPELDGSKIEKPGDEWPVAVGDHIKEKSSPRIETVLALEADKITYSQSDGKVAVPVKVPKQIFLQKWAAGTIVKAGDMPAAERRAELARVYGGAVADAIMKRPDLASNMAILDASQAHHIIPVELWGPVVGLRKLIESGWDPNAVLNGVALAEGFHGNHPRYTKFVADRIMTWVRNNGGNPTDATIGPFRAYVEGTLLPEMRGLIAQAKARAAKTGETLNDIFT
jgi:hypothetical protein